MTGAELANAQPTAIARRLALDRCDAGGLERHLEDAEQVQREDDEQRADRCDEERLLELKAPPDRGARRAQASHDARQREHRSENTRGVGRSVSGDLAATPMRELGDVEHLDREDRQDARHQVQDQAAEQRERERMQDGKAR